MSEHFTSLAFDIQTGVVSDEDTSETWETTKKVRLGDNQENEESRPPGIFFRIIDYSESEYLDMWMVSWC